MRRAIGFTLIELATTVAIIAICAVGVTMVIVIKGFFIELLGNYGIAYFNPERLQAMGITHFYALEYATEAIMMFAAIASWLGTKGCWNSSGIWMPQLK